MRCRALSCQDDADREVVVNKRGRYVETREYVGMVRRSLRALSRRVGNGGDVELLGDMLALQREYDAAVVAAVAGLREQYSWQEIADRAGITRQSAHEKWAKKITELEEANG
jgi:hypothetical protein